jgi:hypothetical protein
MNAKSVEAPQGRWWSIPKAIVWIVTRDETQVADAAGIRFLSEIKHLTLRPFAEGGEPPISPGRAQDEFLSAVRRATVEIFGRECGEGKPVRVFLGGMMMEPELADKDGGICIVDGVGGWPIYYWSELSIRSGECMRRWPVEAAPHDNKQIADGALIPRVLALVSQGNSYRAATLAISDDDLPGRGNLDSRRRRLAAKARETNKSRKASK